MLKRWMKAIFVTVMVMGMSSLSAKECSTYTGKAAGGGAGAAAGAYICYTTIGLGVLLTPFTGGTSNYAAILMCAGEIVGAANTGYEVGEKVEKIARGCE
jgi:uncharacterized protein YqgC (DUF456 family)